MKNPVALLLIALGTFGGVILGHAKGRSGSEQRIQELQKEILKLQRLIAQRDAMEFQVRESIQRAWQEIEIIRGQRIVVAQFAEWMAQEHPEVLQRYRRIQQGEAHIADLERQGATTRKQLLNKQELLRTELAKCRPSAMS